MTTMTEYPEFRTVRWVDDNGNEVGSCEYVRADRIESLERENERLRDHMDEINAIVDECEYDKKTRKTVDRLRAIAKETA